MAAILRITDGTVTINFLKGAGQAGFHLARWRPVISGYKGGGTWQDSSLADGRRLADRKFENGLETFDLKLLGPTQNQAIYESRLLRILLEKAADYWTGWQDEPVWLEAKGTCETNSRFAIVHVGAIPEDENPFAQPFLQADGSAVMDKLTLVVERGPWLSCLPGTGTLTEASAVEMYDGRNLGNVDAGGTRQPTTADVYVANKRNTANLTDVWFWNGAAWNAANLMDAALPYAFLPAIPAAGHVVVFGIDTTLANSGPFSSSLVFDIGTVQNNLTIVWRFSQGGADPTAWPALTVLDYTNNGGAMTGQPFNTAGVASVHWERYISWTAFNPTIGGVALGVTGYWVAAHVTGVGAAPSPPTQQNRDIYSIVWPYAEVQAAAVGGDVPALLRAKVRNVGDRETVAMGHNPSSYANRVVCGLRSYDRGPNFTAYLNIADEQNPGGVAVGLGTDTAFQNDPVTPSGRRARCTFATNLNLIMRVQISLGAAIVSNFYGIFHVYLRAKQNGGAAGDITVQLRVRMQDQQPYFRSGMLTLDPTLDWQLLDFGRLDIPGMPLLPSEGVDVAEMLIYASSTSSTPDLYLYDLILMPTDEWAGDFYDTSNNAYSLLGDVIWDGGGTAFRRYLDVDSVRYPKWRLRSPLKLVTNDRVVVYYAAVSAGGEAVLQANARQRLWFLAARFDIYGGDTWLAQPWLALAVQLERVQRYLSMRGTG